MFDYGDGKGHWNRCEMDCHTIRSNAFSFPQLNGFDLVYKMFSITIVMRGLPYQCPENVSQLLSHPICDRTPAGHRGALFVHFA